MIKIFLVILIGTISWKGSAVRNLLDDLKLNDLKPKFPDAFAVTYRGK